MGLVSKLRVYHRFRKKEEKELILFYNNIVDQSQLGNILDTT